MGQQRRPICQRVCTRENAGAAVFALITCGAITGGVLIPNVIAQAIFFAIGIVTCNLIAPGERTDEEAEQDREPVQLINMGDSIAGLQPRNNIWSLETVVDIKEAKDQEEEEEEVYSLSLPPSM